MQEPVAAPAVFRKGLLLHCGAEVVDRGTLSREGITTERFHPQPGIQCFW